jgi:hypothetical protein
MGRTKNEFQTIRSEGGLLPPDLLRRVVDTKGNLPGAKPEDYGLPAGERLNEAITQSWNRMRRHWADFRAAARNLPEAEAGTGLTNDKWSVPLLRELGFGLLPTTPGPEIAGKTYAINRFFGTTAVHLVGCNLSLDRRAAGVRGATTNPHGLVQEFLNRSGNHLWAIVSNGLRFRVLRDNQALSRQSYLEFDLEAMFSGEVYSDFVLLWLMAHATRFAPQRENQPESCWLEQWTKVAEEDGTRALGDLRSGVEKALQILGEAFVSHPRNTTLRESLRTEKLSLNDFHGQLLRIVYRLIFLFVAEDRTLDGISLLHPLDDSDHGRQARDRYAANYSTARLRELAGKIKGSRHGDLWQQFNLLVGALSGDERFEASRRHLALPTLGSFLWSPKSTLALNAANLQVGEGVELANGDFLESLRHLAFTRQGKMLRPVDYKNLGAEELGGVYESLLALTPQISGDGNRFTFAEFAGNERKTSGSYYSPDSLVQCLLDSALDPVVEEALKGKNGVDAEKAILSLKVCDPAVGSGHFLVGAAHRLARHLARVRANAQGESEPSPLLYQHALRDVIGRCLYGVDIKPMSAELCRVSLWLEALEPGKPLSFLDHHIQVGNSLLGTTPALLAAGIPDDAFVAIEGDVKAKCAELKRDNKRERNEFKSGQGYLFDPPFKLGNLAAEFAKIDDTPDDSTENILEKERRYAELVRGQAYQSGRLLADTWCAAFVWKKDNSDLGNLCPTERTFRKVESHAAVGLLPHVRGEVERLRDQFLFFHWHLAFPDVFRMPSKDESAENEQTGWNGGFDVVLGNPPWEHTELKEKEWFAERRPEIANARTGVERKRMIEALRVEDPLLYSAFIESLREHDGASHFLGNSGRYPLCGRGRINLYAVFAESMRLLLSEHGRVGCVLPSGIATDDTTKFFFQNVVQTRSLASLFDFENRLGLFPAVDNRMKFCLFTAGRGTRPTADAADFVFFAHAVKDLFDHDRRFTLSAADIELLNPNTRTCPIFRSSRDSLLTKAIARRTPPLLKEGPPQHNPWNLRIRRIFNMGLSEVSALAKPVSEVLLASQTRDNALESRLVSAGEYVPMLEGKMFQAFNHRAAGVEFNPSNVQRGAQGVDSTDRDLADPFYAPRALYWYPRSELVGTDPSVFDGRWTVGFKDIASVTNERTMIAAILPYAATNFTVRVVQFLGGVEMHACTSFIACVNSFTFDYLLRQSLGGLHVSDYITHQVPVIPPVVYANRRPWQTNKASIAEWLVPRVLELTFTAWNVEPFARDCGYSGPPFIWDEDRRFLLRAELDAAFFHLYLAADTQSDWKPARQSDGYPYDETPEQMAELKRHFPTPRDAVAYILDTFPIVRRKDEAAHNGDYRTKRVILEIYDAMQEAIRTGNPYQTRLDPPPGPPATPLPEWPIGGQRPANWPAHIHPPRGVHESD